MNKKLKPKDYLKMLQLEYLTCKVRALIYEKPEIIKMNEDVARMKKEKILNLCTKFGLRSIFASERDFREFYHSVFVDEDSLLRLNMQYSTDENKATKQLYYDKLFFFKKGTDVDVIINSSVYKVIENRPNEDCVIIALTGKHSTKVNYANILRTDISTAFGGKLI